MDSRIAQPQAAGRTVDAPRTRDVLLLLGVRNAGDMAGAERAVRALDGVLHVQGQTDTARLSVEYNPLRVAAHHIDAAVTAAGYRVERDAMHITVALPVGGMTCASCVGRVEAAIGAVTGVRQVAACPITGQATITFDPDVLRLRDLKAAVSVAGYTPLEIVSEPRPGQQTPRRAREMSRHRRSAALAWGFAVPLLLLALGEGLGLPGWLQESQAPARFALVQWGLLIPVLLAARSIFRVGLLRLLRRSPNGDSLVVLGAGAALIHGGIHTVSILAGHGAPADGARFSALAATILAFSLLGRLLTAMALRRTASIGDTFLARQPSHVAVVGESGSVLLPVEEVMPGDVLLVLAGEAIPLDGVIVQGHSAVDESLLSGKARPVERRTGDAVTGGTINRQAALQVRVTRVGEDTTLAGMIRQFEAAQQEKPRIGHQADRAARMLVPLALTVALVAAGGWWLMGQPLTVALSVFIAVVVLAAPGAFGLVVPVATMVARAQAAQSGVLITDGAALERLHGLTELLLTEAAHGRPDAPAAMAWLQASGLRVALVAGDDPAAAAAVARQAGITTAIENADPTHLVALVQARQAAGARVAVVGDPLRDGAALTQAEVGVAVRCTGDVASGAGHVVLLNGSIHRVAMAVQLSRATMRNIRYGLLWAGVYHVAGISMAAGLLHGFGGPFLHPIWAAAAMSLSPLLVVVNAWRLRRFRLAR